MKRVLFAVPLILLIVFCATANFSKVFAANAEILKDIYPGTGESSPDYFVNFNGALYFSANDGTNGTELWKTDGTEAGTVLVKDIYSGASSGVPSNMIIVGDWIFFDAQGAAGIDLWKTDGTSDGTTLVKHLSNSYNSSMNYPVNVNGTLFFWLDDYSTYGHELYKSDGTSDGTVLVKDIKPGTGDTYLNSYPVAVGNVLYFTSGINFYKSDGTSDGTVIVKSFSGGITGFAAYNDSVFLGADDGSGIGTELWKSDGTIAGTILLKDIMTGADSSSPSRFVEFNNTLYFWANNNANWDSFLFKSDGTASGTVAIANTYTTPEWRDSTTYTPEITNIDNNLYFTIDYPPYESELWKSDGTETGTGLVKDINAAEFGEAYVSYLTNINGVLYFSADDGTHGAELWKSDGTESGTAMISDIYIEEGWGSYPAYLTELNGNLIFQAANSEYGTELWILRLTTLPEESTDQFVIDKPLSNPGPSTCNGFVTPEISDLFQINIKGTKATLYFTPLNNVTGYYISYSEKPDTYQHGIEFNQGNSTGVLSYTVNNLKPNTNYFFMIRGQNGCMPGLWSGQLKVKSSLIDSANPLLFYKYF